MFSSPSQMPVIVTPASVINTKLQRIPKPRGVSSWRVTRADGTSKKYVVVICHTDGTRKTLRFGDASMEDYTQHRDERRKARFMARFAKAIALYKDDHMRPMFYSYHLLWC